MQVALNEYKQKVESIDMLPSDRKKMLSLPFYLAKRSEKAEPRRGQVEFDLFTELTNGLNWYGDSTLLTDEETKITEFDYENHLHPKLV